MPSTPASPTFTTGFVIVDDDGNVGYEPPPALRDQLEKAVLDGDLDTTKHLLDKIHDRSGWCGEIDTREHFDVLSHALQTGMRAGLAATSAACLRAMGGDRALREMAQREMPQVLRTVPASQRAGDLIRLPAAALDCWARLVTEAGLTGILTPGAAASMLGGVRRSTPLLRAAMKEADQFLAVIEGYAHAGREKLVRGESLLSLMQGRANGGETVLLAAALQNGGTQLHTFLKAAHAARRGNALSEKEYVQLISEGRPGSTVLAALCEPTRLVDADEPPALDVQRGEALATYLQGLLLARLPSAVSLSDKTFAEILLSPGSDGRPAIRQCSQRQAREIRSRLQRALETGMLPAPTVQKILAQVPEVQAQSPAEVRPQGHAFGDRVREAVQRGDIEKVWELHRRTPGPVKQDLA
ncbi:hypothetical protein [Mitsuaria sp. 7]|uniref:hypothetical protein n=1 Tax=Mitsuaria sp. 7 TaxID=1658665 RepID=UPI0007DD1357|nr:hypothetical protein [Mitsuaria sp. 7]ANH68680.1 hypothetical protein ABE85_15875 [Mitsuaria sp. 7]